MGIVCGISRWRCYCGIVFFVGDDSFWGIRGCNREMIICYFVIVCG